MTSVPAGTDAHGPFPSPTHAAQYWFDRARKAEGERDALREAIERDAADRAYAAGMGASEWQAFVSPRLWDALGLASPVAATTDEEQA